MQGKKFLAIYWQGIDVKNDKLILVPIKLLIKMLNKYKNILIKPNEKECSHPYSEIDIDFTHNCVFCHKCNKEIEN